MTGPPSGFSPVLEQDIFVQPVDSEPPPAAELQQSSSSAACEGFELKAGLKRWRRAELSTRPASWAAVPSSRRRYLQRLDSPPPRLCLAQGVFIQLVQANSPSALAGLRFGDQVLQINGQNCAGWSTDKAHKALKAASETRIELVVRDR